MPGSGATAVGGHVGAAPGGVTVVKVSGGVGTRKCRGLAWCWCWDREPSAVALMAQWCAVS
ncbi:hypothetical protein I551_4018 [Mycobacterium ulcerans str. Harvey]|uniref:Uncharacterized protein n=1 Tax=Mycobacterium ulcerans str. Harvey TaxID=1299332 RepID=A0ABP3AF18_MYCUL|nr:hypothetical protein I551_4018 [Mycobacterium ulcerans str. Harvey]